MKKNFKGFILTLALSLSLQTIFSASPSPFVIQAAEANNQEIYKVENLSLDGTIEKVVDLTSKVQTFASLNEGIIHARFRLSNTSPTNDGGLMTLFSLSNTNVADTYVSFYVNPKTKKVGYELKNNGTTINSVAGSAQINDKNWHTVSYVFNQTSGTQQIYFDGKKIQESNKPAFLSSLTDNINTARVGNLSRSGRGNHIWTYQGDIDYLKIVNTLSNEEDILALHQATIDQTIEKEEPAGTVKTKTIDLFKAGYENSNSYRIPSLLTVDTTSGSAVIAAIDKRNKDAADWFDIDTVIRRSFDNGATWENIQTLIDLPEKENLDAAFTIDASMVQDKSTGKIFLLVDMFPESYALGKSSLLETGTGWKNVNGKDYFILRDYPVIETTGSLLGRYTTEYLLDMETGIVYLESNMNKTEYSVPKFHTGELLKNDVPAGNIFMYSKDGNPGEINAVRTSYLWMVSSDDGGATWTDPIDITNQVKKDWMLFIGTGPGVGIQIKNGTHKGRLVYPIYYSNRELGGSQASAVIYSDDNGTTWTLGESPMKLTGFDPETMNNSSKLLTENQVVEVGNTGVLKMFCRNRSGLVQVATSDDGGTTWKSIYQDSQLMDPYCQLSIIPYSQLIDGKQAFIFSNPADTSRINGTIKIGLYDEASDTFDWKYKRLLHPSAFQYSSLTELSDNTIAILYEGDVPNMKYTSFNKEWVMAGDPVLPMPKPSITGITMTQSGSKLTFTVDFDQYILKTGTPQLKFTLAGKDKFANYSSGAGTKQLTFIYTLANGEGGDINAVNIMAASGSTIGNRNNDVPADVSYPLKAIIYSSGSSGGSSSSSSTEKPKEDDKKNEDKKEDKKESTWDDLLTELEKDSLKTVVLESKDSLIIPNGFLEKLSDVDGKLQLKGTGYHWIIKGSDVTDKAKGTPNLTVTKSNDKTISSILTNANVKKANKVKEISIKETSNWGFKGTLTVETTKENANKKLFVNWYNSKTKQLESVKTVTASKKGTVSFPCEKGGKYVITTKNPILKPTVPKKATITSGKTNKISTNNVLKNAKVSYQSSNKDIVSISKDGTIKGLKKGTTVITSKIVQNGKTYTIKTTYIVK